MESSETLNISWKTICLLIHEYWIGLNGWSFWSVLIAVWKLRGFERTNNCEKFHRQSVWISKQVVKPRFFPKTNFCNRPFVAKIWIPMEMCPLSPSFWSFWEVFHNLQMEYTLSNFGYQWRRTHNQQTECSYTVWIVMETWSCYTLLWGFGYFLHNLQMNNPYKG